LSIIGIGALLSRLGYFDVDGSSVDFLLVEQLDGVVGVSFRIHLDESISERSGSSSDDVSADNFSCDFKLLSKFVFLRGEREISDKDFSSNHF